MLSPYDTQATYSRRRALGAGLGPLVASLVISADSCSQRREQLSWDRFRELLSALAAHNGWEPDQEKYVARVERLASHLALSTGDIGRLRTVDPIRTGHPRIEALERTRDFDLMGIVLEKGDYLPPHNHPNLTGVTLCVAGEVVVESFDDASPTTNPRGRVLKLSNRLRLRPGETSTLTVRRGNIHAIRAIERSAVLDIFTPPYDSDRALKTKSFVLQELGGSYPNLWRAVASD